MNSATTTVSNQPPRVLVVEDDLTSREFLHRALEKNGCLVTTADCVDTALHLFARHGFHQFDTVLTDHQMPGQTGLDLLVWLKENDSCLSSIILTAASDKEVITESVRVGASDFLEKPLNLQKLLPALHKAVDLTRRQRHLAETASAVKSLGRAQENLIHFKPVNVSGGGTVQLDICFHPKLEAGGDFFCQFQPAPGKLCCLLTDVSGHDLQAAYISAYFQGLVRGMLQGAKSMLEVFNCFNRFLIEEWSEAAQFRLQKKNASTSVAATSVLLDFNTQTASVLCSGAPAPVYISRKGHAELLGSGGGAPLGWFPEHNVSASTHDISEGGKICFWTDGLDDLADTLGIHPLCLDYVLEKAKVTGQKIPHIDRAADDILVARVHLPCIVPAPSPIRALFLAEYHGGQIAEIDRLEAAWQNNLQIAIQDISETSLHDILLASREAVLNAMKHGCQGDAARKMHYQFSYQPEKKIIKVWVEDSGSGHEFDFDAHAEAAGHQIIDKHRGLIFMTNLAHAIYFENRGATVVMEFNL